MLRAIAMICAVLLAGAASAAETITYQYDALGRLSELDVSGGPSSGLSRTYAYDATDNRTGLAVRGAVTIAPARTIASSTAQGVSIGVNLSGAGGSTPGGTVTFTENGQFLGSTPLYGGQGSIILENFPVGTHTLVASYSGDGANVPYTLTFTLKVQNLSWLPAVLEMLLNE